MKPTFFLLSLAVLVCGWQSCQCQSSEGLTSVVAGQFNALNRQLSAVQAILSELSRSMTETVNTGTKAVNSHTDSMASSFNILVSQLSTLQQALTSVSTQAQRIVESSSRIATGRPLAAPVDSVTTASETNQVESSGSSVSHSLAETAPAVLLVRALDSATKQLTQMTSVVQSMSQGMSSMVQSGARTLAVNRLNPTDSVLEVMEEYTKQVTEVQKTMRNANNLLNRLLETGSFGDGLQRQKRADTMVVTGLQKALNELTNEIGQIGGTLARIAGGVSGVRIPGLGTDTRGAEDSSAFQGLNPVGAISRGFGNLASSLSRVLPSSG